MTQIERTEVDGITTFWAPADGPFVATLKFRTGVADEPLPARGITHLVEHLALFASSSRSDEANGFVDLERCVFYARGEQDEVLGWLRRCTEALADLPLDRLATERRILRAEEGGRQNAGVLARLLDLRFGADGYGLINYRELGLRWLGADEVAGWARERFTRGNAVLWVSGEPPDGLELALPDGDRLPPPRVEPIPGREGRRFEASGTGGLAFSGLAERSTALNAAMATAYERLYSRLRRELGLVYEPWSGYEVLGPSHAHVMMGAECPDEKATLVAGEVWRLITDLAENGVTAEEIEQHRRRFRQMEEEPGARIAELDHAADQHLVGEEPVDRAAVDRELGELSAQDVAAAVTGAFENALLVVPGNVTTVAGFEPTAFEWPAPVDGVLFSDDPARGGVGSELRVGDRGLTVSSPKTDAMTIEWDQLVLVETAPADTMRFSARDGSWMEVCLAAFLNAGLARERVLGHLPGITVIPTATVEATDAVEALAFRLEDEHHVAAELAALPRELGEDEVPEAIMAYRHGDHRGLLTLTSDRLIRWYLTARDSDGEAIPRDAIRRAHVRRRLLRPPVLVVEHDQPLELPVYDEKAAEALVERLGDAAS